jgi:hypothetical protein
MIYLFSSANSFNSILTIDKKSKGEGHADSIFEIAVEKKLDKVFIIEKNPSSFPQALKNATDLGLQLVYGLKLTVCEDSDTKDLESCETEHKLIFLAKTGRAYKECLMKLYSDAATRGNYNGLPRTDFKRIKQFWGDEMVMMVPFYDNFLERNLTTFSNCMVKFKGFDPIFTVEYNELPLDRFMKKKILDYCAENGHNYLDSQTVYYKKEEDVLPFMVYKTIQKKSDINCPNLDGMCSSKFCIEKT